MVRRITRVVIASVFVAMAAGVTPSLSGQPDATLTLSGGGVAAGVGYSWSKGALNYQGRTYPVRVRGLSLGPQVGASQVEIVGPVFNLARLENFNGNYAGAGAEGALAGGAGVTVLRNERGVVLYLTSTTRGAMFKLSTEGLRMTLAQE